MYKTHCDLCGTVIETTGRSESVRYSKKEISFLKCCTIPG